MVIALTGSTGKLGGQMARNLGSRVDRLIVRDSSRAPRIDGGPAVFAASYEDGAAARQALTGVDVVFMVSATESPTRCADHRTFIAAAADSGVRHVVYTSFAGAADDAVFTFARDHIDTERAIRDSGMAFTLLRNCSYADMFPMFADDRGVIEAPAGDGRVAAVARADVADVASAILIDPDRHAGATYLLTGPEAFTVADAARRMSAVLGREFSYAEQTIDDAYASRRPFSDQQWELDGWVSSFTAIASGELSEVSSDIEKLTGRSARTLEQALTEDGPTP